MCMEQLRVAHESRMEAVLVVHDQSSSAIKEDAKDLPVGDKSGLEHSATRNCPGMANCR